jgi:hypothetical protein
LFFNLGDMIDNFEESALAKEFVLFFLEIFAERIELVRAHDSAKSRKQHCVLARFVRAIHADKLAHRIGKLPSIICILERMTRREMHRYVGQPPPGLVLLQKHIHKIDKFVRLLEAREKKILFQLFVIIFDEIANDFCGISQRLGRQILFAIDPPDSFAVNEQNAFEHAVSRIKSSGGEISSFSFSSSFANALTAAPTPDAAMKIPPALMNRRRLD